MHALLDWFWPMSLPQAAMGLLVGNVVLFLLAITFGHLLLWWFADRPVTERPGPIERRELLLAGGCVVLNTVVSVAGWWLWTRGYIGIRRDAGWRAWADVFILLIAMDLAMYCFHRVAHVRWLYPFVHVTHHRYDKPRPLNLFVLNPFEVLGFGVLWLTVLCLYDAAWLGIVVYLAINLAFGTVGHLGVEPLPRAWLRLPGLRYLGTSTFHAEHHQDARGNYGFYTTIWDRLFGTLDARYR
jgi:sterol desaturase/sphingolipid hydroxylase (fatty acid hydroxylase superfamily)